MVKSVLGIWFSAANTVMLRSLYGYFDNEIGHCYNDDNRPFEMFHGSTNDSVKTFITESFADSDGITHVLFATIAFGIGVDCMQLYSIMHHPLIYARRAG